MVEKCWINEQIAVSRAFLDEDIPCLKKEGIDAVVDVRSEYCDDRELIEGSGILFFHVAIDDGYTPTFEQLGEVFDFVDPLLDAGKRILIHCQNGTGRSPMVAIAVLAKRGMDLSDAISLIEDKRPNVGFSDRQVKFIYMELDKLR